MSVKYAGLLAIAALPLCAQMQNNQPTSKCGDNGWSDRGHYCEIRDQRIPATGKVTINPGQNGGVSVKGWDSNEILVRARVETNADTDAQAKSDAGQIRISTAGGQIQADGPQFTNGGGWGVSFEVLVPHNTDVTLTTHNGGVSVSDVRGSIEFDTINGGVNLKRLAGNVHGQTRNGGLNVELMGDRWDGNSLDVKSQNGGVNIGMPASYNARFETSTVNGHISIDFPVVVSGKLTHELSTNIGSGGALVRAVTTNGGVKVHKI